MKLESTFKNVNVYENDQSYLKKSNLDKNLVSRK